MPPARLIPVVVAVVLSGGGSAAVAQLPPPTPEPGSQVRVVWADEAGEERTVEGRLVSTAGGRVVVEADPAGRHEVPVSSIARLQIRNKGSDAAFIGGFLAGALVGGVASSGRDLESQGWSMLIAGGLGGVVLSRAARRRRWIDTRLPSGRSSSGMAWSRRPDGTPPGPVPVPRLRPLWPSGR